MKIPVLTFVISFISLCASSQSYPNQSALLLEDIMKGQEWMGYLPENPEWAVTGVEFYFEWNPLKEVSRSKYKYDILTGEIDKLEAIEEQNLIPDEGDFSSDRQLYVFSRNGNLYLLNLKETKVSLLADLDQNINSPSFSGNDSLIFFNTQSGVYSRCQNTGSIKTIMKIERGEQEKENEKSSNDQEKWLYNEELSLFDVLRKEKEKDEIEEKHQASVSEKKILTLYTGKAMVFGLEVSPTGKYVAFRSYERNNEAQNTKMPRFITESGFTEIEEIRAKVGFHFGSMKLGIADLESDTIFYPEVKSLPGIHDFYEFEVSQKVVRDTTRQRDIYVSSPIWSETRDLLLLNIRSADNKDRWITLLDPAKAEIEVLDRQTDTAWIAGPGIGWSTSSGTLGWLKDNEKIYYQSEESGYSHLYLYDPAKGKTKQLTKGKFEVYDPKLSSDGQYFYFHANAVHPGERHFYRMEVDGGRMEKLTHMKGRNDVLLSPDEKILLIRYSYANQPWELYLDKGEGPVQITESLTKEFLGYTWRIPEFIWVKASDGEMIPARLYRPEPEKANGAAVIFVHGAGYLQNAHKWWSNYYREYMFHNFLSDNGYTVLDMDYRASAGYGRDWRTAIYRHMGGKDLSDNVDGARYLVENENVDPNRIGIYGGSYGGFITLMAMFNSPGTFKAGAALRPVTDWAHYNHGYTSNILNVPFRDSLAYRRSSPIYFAEGLQDHLLMCHGMVDDNVHFQDVVRLSQKLIELQKDHWELAVYPVEAHGFEEWTSWLDEYKRIYKLFSETIGIGKQTNQQGRP